MEISVSLHILSQKLLDKSFKIAVAESCTGGGLAEVLTLLPGSSDWFDCGVVSYSNAAKNRFLGVLESTLLRDGAVSEAVAIEMAEGLLKKSGADITISVTGVAGPSGGSIDKPVGTVWLAWAGQDFKTMALDFLFEGERAQVRARAIDAAIQGAIERL